MKTISRHLRLRGAVMTGAIALLAVAFSHDAFAAATMTPTHQTARRATRIATHPACYVLSSASSIPLRCDRFGVFPTTTIPILVFGRLASR